MTHKEKQDRSFEEVCRFARLKYAPRADKSRAKNMAQTYFINPVGLAHMVLYEIDRQIKRGGDKPEVYWVVIDQKGHLHRMAATSIRKLCYVPGFSFYNGVWNNIWEALDNATEESGTHQ